MDDSELPDLRGLPDELIGVAPPRTGDIDDIDEIDSVSGAMGELGGVPGGRHEARERAMHLLYEAEQKRLDLNDLLAQLPVAPDPYAVGLVEGVAASRPEIDETISACARGWTLHRMPALDRAVLRIATYELAHRPDVPTGAVINEAVELAKTYSTADSGRFVNGVLSAVAKRVRP